MQKINYWVTDYEETKNWFTSKLGWECFMDFQYSDTGRWIELGPKPRGKDKVILVLSLAISDAKKKLVGSQVGEHILGVLNTDNLAEHYKTFQDAGVKFRGEPTEEAWGTGAIFQDLYGNSWYLCEPKDYKEEKQTSSTTEPKADEKTETKTDEKSETKTDEKSETTASGADKTESQPKEPSSVPHQYIAVVTLLAKDIEETKNWYVNKLGFTVFKDVAFGEGQRWLEMGPTETKECPVFTVVAAPPGVTVERVGQQEFLLVVDDLDTFYKQAKAKAVEFIGEPKAGYGGTDAQFVDNAGNKWNVRQPSQMMHHT